MSKVKLTAAQAALLCEIQQTPQPVVAYYAPAIKLVELQLAEWTQSSFPLLKITDAGRDLLERLSQ